MTTTIAERVEQVAAGLTQRGLPPNPVQTALREVVKRRKMEGLAAIMPRAGEFDGELRAMLTGILMDPEARQVLDRRLDIEFAASRAAFNRSYRENGPRTEPEVVIGAGVHAAIYCAARARKAAREGKRFIPPLVIDANERVGGAFGITSKPSFYLNSRNRAGAQGAPGEGGALNYLPGAPVQPYDITNTEYQTNVSVADVVRLTLAMYARVVPRQRVEALRGIGPYRPNLRGFYLLCGERSQSKVMAERAICALGLGGENMLFTEDMLKADVMNRVLTYGDFLRRMDTPFPFQGMHRVAVIGRGDSGKTVIEALTGQGPQPGMSTLALDRIDRIDWYGPGAGATEADWCDENRGRYRRIGRLFRANGGDPRQVNPYGIAERLGVTPDAIFINGRPYDHVVVAAGFSLGRGGPVNGDGYGEKAPVDIGGRTVAWKLSNGYQPVTDLPGIYQIGPCAAVPTDALEQSLPAYSRQPENVASIFRYAPRTAAFAERFPS